MQAVTRKASDPIDQSTLDSSFPPVMLCAERVSSTDYWTENYEGPLLGAWDSQAALDLDSHRLSGCYSLLSVERPDSPAFTARLRDGRWAGPLPRGGPERCYLRAHAKWLLPNAKWTNWE